MYFPLKSRSESLTFAITSELTGDADALTQAGLAAMYVAGGRDKLDLHLYVDEPLPATLDVSESSGATVEQGWLRVMASGVALVNVRSDNTVGKLRVEAPVEAGMYRATLVETYPDAIDAEVYAALVAERGWLRVRLANSGGVGVGCLFWGAFFAAPVWSVGFFKQGWGLWWGALLGASLFAAAYGLVRMLGTSDRVVIPARQRIGEELSRGRAGLFLHLQTVPPADVADRPEGVCLSQ